MGLWADTYSNDAQETGESLNATPELSVPTQQIG